LVFVVSDCACDENGAAFFCRKFDEQAAVYGNVGAE
jgi:hypothetical protein